MEKKEDLGKMNEKWGQVSPIVRKWIEEARLEYENIIQRVLNRRKKILEQSKAEGEIPKETFVPTSEMSENEVFIANEEEKWFPKGDKDGKPPENILFQKKFEEYFVRFIMKKMETGSEEELLEYFTVTLKFADEHFYEKDNIVKASQVYETICGEIPMILKNRGNDIKRTGEFNEIYEEANLRFAETLVLRGEVVPEGLNSLDKDFPPTMYQFNEIALMKFKRMKRKEWRKKKLSQKEVSAEEKKILGSEEFRGFSDKYFNERLSSATGQELIKYFLESKQYVNAMFRKKDFDQSSKGFLFNASGLTIRIKKLKSKQMKVKGKLLLILRDLINNACLALMKMERWERACVELNKVIDVHIKDLIEFERKSGVTIEVQRRRDLYVSKSLILRGKCYLKMEKRDLALQDFLRVTYFKNKFSPIAEKERKAMMEKEKDISTE